jgi:hypothetical protein
MQNKNLLTNHAVLWHPLLRCCYQSKRISADQNSLFFFDFSIWRFFSRRGKFFHNSHLLFFPHCFHCNMFTHSIFLFFIILNFLTNLLKAQNIHSSSLSAVKIIFNMVNRSFKIENPDSKEKNPYCQFTQQFCREFGASGTNFN